MFNPEVLLRISKEVGAPVSRVETTLKLLEEGATVPFIARYRKEATGNLDEVKIRDIDEKRHYYKDLEDRRNTILASIEKQGQLTDELKAKILASYSKNELEDLYLPYKPKRKTKASVALERGLEPLARYIWDQTGTDPVGSHARYPARHARKRPDFFCRSRSREIHREPDSTGCQRCPVAIRRLAGKRGPRRL